MSEESKSSPPPLPETLVEVRSLNRVFDRVHAVHDVNFDIRRGQVVGFIGANGAGKTTTMRIMATLDAPSSGMVRIAGHDVMQHPGTRAQTARLDAGQLWHLLEHDGF